MALALHWTIPNVEGESLTLEFTGLNDETPKKTVTLYPKNREIKLTVYHTPADEIGNTPNETLPKPGEVARHFAPYYDLYEGYVDRNGREPLPLFASKPPRAEGAGESGGTGEKAARRGSRITCMVAQGEIED
jgi:hypothetical protein